MITPIPRKQFTCGDCGAHFYTTAPAKRCPDCRRKNTKATRPKYDCPGGIRRER
jgi:rubrerythrin